MRALLLALSFHQALEGLSLASVINGGGFSRRKALAMVATYSVTCPLGIAIGGTSRLSLGQVTALGHSRRRGSNPNLNPNETLGPVADIGARPSTLLSTGGTVTTGRSIEACMQHNTLPWFVPLTP